MDRFDAIKTPKVDRALLRQFHQHREYVTGTLCLTDRHLIFIEPTGTQETWVLYHHVYTIERLPLTTRGYPIVIETKTFQQLHIIIPKENECLNVIETIQTFARPEKYTDLFAFQYKPKEWDLMKQSSGWVLYDAQTEYGRMGLPNDYWRHTNLNANYELCETYSCHIFVPTSADKSIITGSAKFRSKGRLPVLSYFYDPKKTALCRCSQPLSGLRGRSVEDQQMIQALINANPNSDFMYVIDTRPKLNAVANKAAGKGYENTDHYNNVVYEFYNIHNIHIMRESLQKMIEASCSPTQTTSGFLTGLEASGWLKHIHLILEASIFAAKCLSKEGVNVLVHCSDGWDRTAQTCALTCLFIDPYYRTLHGFMILLEKEWLAFGHKFSIRSGHLAGEMRETSPIFTQFLECVWQTMIQYPTAFQFNEHFLVTLHDHIYSCQFGTFLGNCERERLENRFNELTYSFWGYVWSHLDDFLNPLFADSKPGDGEDNLLLPNSDIPHLSFWTGLYCRHPLRQHVCEVNDEVLASLKQQNTCLSEHIKYLQLNLTELNERLAHFQKKIESENGHESLDTSDQQKSKAENGPSEAVTVSSTAQGTSELETSLPLDSNVPTTVVENSSEQDTSNSALHGVISDRVNNDTVEVEDKGAQNTDDDQEDEGKQSARKNLKIDIPHSNHIAWDKAENEASSSGEPVVKNSDPTGTMSPKSYSVFKDYLVHPAEMNLPWQPMRSVTQCSCGVAFSFSVRKYHCSHCGEVVCGSCGSFQAPLPWQPTPKRHRVCRTCFKLMNRRIQELDIFTTND